jgi:hypothetical protein
MSTVEPTDTGSTELEWSDPPPRPVDAYRGGPGPSPKWAAVKEQLEARPGEWALIPFSKTDKRERATALKNRIESGRVGLFKADEVEARSSIHTDATADQPEQWGVWARYVGDSPDPVHVLKRRLSVPAIRRLADDIGVSKTGVREEIAERIVNYFGDGIDVTSLVQRYGDESGDPAPSVPAFGTTSA